MAAPVVLLLVERCYHVASALTGATRRANSAGTTVSASLPAKLFACLDVVTLYFLAVFT